MLLGDAADQGLADLPQLRLAPPRALDAELQGAPGVAAEGGADALTLDDKPLVGPGAAGEDLGVLQLDLGAGGRLLARADVGFLRGPRGREAHAADGRRDRRGQERPR